AQGIGPAFRAILEEAECLVHRALLEHRTNLSTGLQPIAQLEGACVLTRRFSELLGNVLVNEEATRRDANLAIIAELAHNRDLGPDLWVGVREDDEWRMTAQLQANALELIGRTFHQLLADFGRAGKAD